MNRTLSVSAAALLCILSSSFSYFLFAQDARREHMTFFVTSVGMGNGANLGGLAGADRHCQMLAQAAGAGNKTWRAYLSTQASGNQPAVNARDRIGQGPWYNADGAEVATNLAGLHGETGGAPINRTVGLTETGRLVPVARHDILTGTQRNGQAYTDGMDHTCNNWASNAAGSAQVGHHDRVAGGGGGIFGDGTGRGGRADQGEPAWNSSHATNGCSQENLMSTNGAGLFYCFATN